MCGIVGIAAEPGHVQADELIEWRDRMRHRGPDDAGYYVNDDRSVGLGHRRLAMVDLSSRGRQPMSAGDGRYWIVFNGEIYNFRTLRRELARGGHNFLTETDTEVILAAYSRWGTGCLQRLRGMFAFALWDAPRRRLWLVRDRVGIKPLFYRWDGARLWFASELKGLQAASLSLDETAVYDFLTYGYVPAPKTIYRQVRKLEPGHTAVFQDGKLQIDRYWDPPVPCGGSPITAEQAGALVRDKLTQAVEQHLAADVPVGVMLSGGVDSSAVATLSGKPAGTFSIGFDVAAHSETSFARLVAERLHTEHYECTLTREMALDSADRVLALYDEPFGDASAIPTYFLSVMARRQVKAVLSGEGGDEVFGGYNWYARWLRFGARPQLWLRPAARLWPDQWRGHWTLQCRSLDPLERYAHILGAFSRREKQAIFDPDLVRRMNGYDDLWHFRRHWRAELDPLTRLQYLDLKTYLPDDVLTKLDRATMAVGLEGRVPLLDHELVEFVFRLPARMRWRGGEKKFLLKQAVHGAVPEAVLERPKKGFSPPLENWLPGPQAKDATPAFPGLLRPTAGFPPKANHGHGLWRVMALGRWLRQNA